MIHFMTGILSMHRVIRSILHLSVAKFQGFPRIITSISSYFNSCLKSTSIKLLSGRGSRTHLLRVTIGLYPIFPFSFSVHPSQERPWSNTGSQGFSRLICWGYVCLLLIQGYVPGWIRFVRQVLVCVHSDGIVTCSFIWMYFYRGSRGDTVHTFLYGLFAKSAHEEWIWLSLISFRIHHSFNVTSSSLAVRLFLFGWK